MVEKVTIQRINPAILSFCLLAKEPDTASKWLRKVGEFSYISANGLSREKTRHLFLQILSHQWTEISSIIYKDIGTAMETLQPEERDLSKAADDMWLYVNDKENLKS